MTIKNDLFLAKVLNTELRYQYLKNTPRFQKTDKQSVRSAKRYLTSNVSASLYVNTIIYGMISLLFGYAGLADKPLISSDSFILFLLLLIMAIMTDTQFYRGIWDMKLLTPIAYLPIKLEKRVVPVALFVYNELYLPFVTLPAGVVFSIGLKSYVPFAVFLMFTILFIYIARTVSQLLGVTSVRTNTNRKTKRMYLGQLVQVVIFIVFILAIEIATNPAFRGYVRVPEFLYFFIPVTYQYISALNVYPFAVFVTIFLLVYLAYSYLNRKSFSDKMETYSNVISKGDREETMKLKSPVRSIIDKDFKILLRRRGAIMIAVIPITFIIPVIPELLSVSPGSNQIIYYVAYVSSIFLLDFMLLIGLEGKAAWHLSALPITRRQFFLSKLLTIFSIGIAYYVIILVVITAVRVDLLPYLLLTFPFFGLLLMAVLIVGGSYLVKEIPREVYSLSQQGIGGRWVFIKTMAIGVPIILLNVLIFAFSSRIIPIGISYYFKGYALTIILDALLSYLFLSLFLRKGDYF